MNKKEVLAIIAARGGSKGVPRKNIRDLAGKPLVAWTIEEAKRSKLVTRLIVSTDDVKIADTAKSFGAEVPFLRPQELAQDLSTDVEYLSHAVDWLKNNEDYDPEIIVRLPPTSPLRRAEQIDQGIDILIDGGDAFDSVRPIVESPKHPYKMWKINGNLLEPLFSEEAAGLKEPWNSPRQILPKVYVHTGAMDIMWRKTLMEKRSTSGSRIGYFFMKAEESVNIDSEIDFLLAEVILKQKFLKK